jgi:hypothetical protein
MIGAMNCEASTAGNSYSIWMLLKVTHLESAHNFERAWEFEGDGRR